MLIVKRGTNGRESMVEEGEAEGEGSPSPPKKQLKTKCSKQKQMEAEDGMTEKWGEQMLINA